LTPDGTLTGTDVLAAYRATAERNAPVALKPYGYHSVSLSYAQPGALDPGKLLAYRATAERMVLGDVPKYRGDSLVAEGDLVRVVSDRCRSEMIDAIDRVSADAFWSLAQRMDTAEGLARAMAAEGSLGANMTSLLSFITTGKINA
jgi:hypothetical protein